MDRLDPDQDYGTYLARVKIRLASRQGSLTTDLRGRNKVGLTWVGEVGSAKQGSQVAHDAIGRRGSQADKTQSANVVVIAWYERNNTGVARVAAQTYFV